MTALLPHDASRTTMLWRSARAVGVALIVIVLGLGVRFYGRGLGVPSLVVKYGGSVLWATMVYFLITALAPRLARLQVAAIAMGVAIIVELIRLVHLPWLDSFRLTLAGALLLGRIFSIWNIAAYAAGLALGLSVDGLIQPAATRSEKRPSP